ncbi:hypothetical protein FNF27_04369 [Cafeteria roenbergensis]|uniref:Glycosyltransferase 61 catalytic domain-containing protein n=1 Tax=Cafeteria roenbergensis TaxID=33653 RepID=A0A5A8EA48_CAFRO|nr:hypothetical protein FNF27_04369 [Cafeteria roenbergensis]
MEPSTTEAYLRGRDVHMRGVCVTANMPYRVTGLTERSCGGSATLLELQNASKNRVLTCSHDADAADRLCSGYVTVLDDTPGDWHGVMCGRFGVKYIEEAVLAPMEFFDYNFGHIVTDGAMAVAAVRFAQANARQRSNPGDRPAGATAARVPTFLWRSRGRPFTDQPLPALWEGYMRQAGLRYLPVSDGSVCFGSVTILAQPLNMLSWHRIASAPFLQMADAWGGFARLTQWPADHPMAGGAMFEVEAVAEAARRVDAAPGSGGPSDPALGGVSRAAVLGRSRALRKRLWMRAPASLLTGPACGDTRRGAGVGSQARKPRVLVINRTGRRRVRNMARLMEWFASNGYEVQDWSPEGASAAEQAQQIQAADVFVSNHGQGQAWGMFMREDAVMVTLCSANQVALGSCTYYPIAARNGGHSTRRIFTMVSKDAQYFQGSLVRDADMQAIVRANGDGRDGGSWHYSATHFEDIALDVGQFATEWAAFLLGDGEHRAPDGSADAFWRFWCNFSDVADAVDRADGEARATSDPRSKYLADRAPRLGEGVALV